MISGNQQSWLTGSRLYFQRDPIGAVGQPMIDFGTVAPFAPTIAVTKIALKDADGGIRKTIADEVVEITESYGIKTFNLNMDNLALAFLADPATVYTQAATQRVSVVHAATPGRLIKIADASGNPAFGLTSIDTVTGPSASPTYTSPADYTVVDLERGFIKMTAGGAFSAAGPIEITYTPRAISGIRQITPHNTSCSVYGTAIIVWGRCNNKEQTARVCRVALAPNSNTWGLDSHSDLGFDLTVLDDLSKPTPSGSLIYWLGNLAAAA